MRQNISKYEVIKNKIEESIKNGVYCENDKIPSESELCQIFSSSRITVRKALDELVTMGVLYRQQGIGTFVKPKEKVDISLEARKILLDVTHQIKLPTSGTYTAN